MHVGEKPYVVTTTSAMNEFRGPLLWGQVELSSRILTPDAVLGLLGQILPTDRRRTLDELGAVEHEIHASHTQDRFTVIAARGGDDVWVEVRPVPKAELPVTVEEPIPADTVAPPEETAAIAQPVEPHVEAAAELPVASPVEATVDAPIHVVEGVDAKEQKPEQREEETATVELPPLFAEQVAPEIPAAPEITEAPRLTREERVQAIAPEEKEEQDAAAPFEIVPEVSQHAPTDADVDALFAASAAALLAAPAARDPYDIAAPEPHPIDSYYEPIAIAPELGLEWAPLVAESAAEPSAIEPALELVLMRVAESEPVEMAPEPPPMVVAPEPEPVPLEFVESKSTAIAIAQELEPGWVAMAAATEPELVGDPEPALAIEEIAPEWIAEVAATEPELATNEPELVPVIEEIEAELVAVTPAEFIDAIADIELEPVTAPWEAEFVPAVAAFEPASVVVAPEPELVGAVAETQSESAGVRWESQPVAMIPGTEPERVSVRWEPEHVSFGAAAEGERECMEWEPQPVRFFGENDLEPASIAAEPEHATAIDEGEPEVVAVAAQPESVPDPVAVAPEPEEPVSAIAVTESQPAGAEPEPVASALEPEPLHADAPQQLSKTETGEAIEPERAVILPIVRRLPTVAPRGEAGGAKAGSIRQEPSSTGGAQLPSEFSIDELLRVAAARGASTVYLVAQSRPMVRAEGDISVLDIGAGSVLEESDIARLMLDLAPAAARDAWQRGASAEWICDVTGVGRVRCMTFRDHRGPGLIFRMIPPQAISADQLGLTAEVQALCAQSDGLVLVTGPRASGKSTLMSAFVDLINRTRSDHLITVESQIGFVHESRKSFISQREVRGNGESVVAAVRSALREDPDVLFINDLSSAEMVSVALDAAESGRLVFASLPAASTVAAVDRLLELLPENRRSHARASLAQSLRGVVAQVLVRRVRGGRSAVREVLLNTAAVAGLIHEAKTTQLTLAMESGRRHGMMPLNDTLVALVREGTVHVTEAHRKAFDKESFLAAMRREGVDTSFAEKLA